MDIETAFAAAVFRACTSDQIEAALADLWACAQALGYRNAETQAVANLYVFWDEQGAPWPRPFDMEKVVVLR